MAPGPSSARPSRCAHPKSTVGGAPAASSSLTGTVNARGDDGAVLADAARRERDSGMVTDVASCRRTMRCS